MKASMQSQLLDALLFKVLLRCLVLCSDNSPDSPAFANKRFDLPCLQDVFSRNRPAPILAEMLELRIFQAWDFSREFRSNRSLHSDRWWI
jgi:hypothetical protein